MDINIFVYICIIINLLKFADMKKFMFVVIIGLFCVSCSQNLNKKIEHEISKETGKKPTENKISEKEYIYKWELVKVGKTDVIKNLLDKTIGALPTTESGLQAKKESIFDTHEEYFVWETPKNKVIMYLIHMIDTDGSFSGDNAVMRVAVDVVNK